jgi:hypothetical protein
MLLGENRETSATLQQQQQQQQQPRIRRFAALCAVSAGVAICLMFRDYVLRFMMF